MSRSDDLLFAEHAVKAGFLTEADVQESLSVQAKMAEMGVEETLRNVLVKRGVLREGDAALVARSAGLRSGREPIPGYTLEARIGSGAMGSVYRALQRGMNRRVAIKILRRDLTDDPRQVERLQREAQLVGRLDHPNIVRGLDSGQTDGLVWFVMELVEGETLRQRIRRQKRLDVEEALTMTRALADALRHAHEHGVVHRDIKPGNVLLTTDGVPRLTDYGLAKGESDDALTQLDATLGTPQYISPEQAKNPRDADIRSDVYSLGATLYAMLAGRPPFQAETLAATLTRVLYEQPAPLREFAPDVPAEVRYVLQRMMAKDRRHRYPDPTALLRDLDALSAGRLAVPAGFDGDIESWEQRRRRRRIVTTAMLTVAAVALLAWAGIGYRTRTLRERRNTEAETELAALLVRPGEPVTWTGETVTSMISALEALRAARPGTPAAETALAELERWRAEEAAIARVQRLSLDLDAADAPDWPRTLSALRAERRRIARGERVVIAARRVEELLSSLTADRDRAAEAALEAALEGLADSSPAAAANRLEAVADDLQRRFFDEPGSAPPSARARELANEFRAVDRELRRHFAPYDERVRGQDMRAVDLQAIEETLASAALAADGDRGLLRRLAELPPRGARTGVVSEWHAERLDRLQATSRMRWEDVRRRADGLVRDGRLDDAVRLLDTFASVALDAERAAAAALRREVTGRRDEQHAELAGAVDTTFRRAFDAIGRREYSVASDLLDELDVLAAGAPPDSEARAVVAAGRELLGAVEERGWEALRRRLVAGELAHGLDVGGGIRRNRITNVRVSGERLDFDYDGGNPWNGSLRDVSAEDVLQYADLPGRDEDPRAAVVAAVFRMLEPFDDLDPREAVSRLAGVAPLLAVARRDERLAPVVARLEDRRRELLAASEAAVLELEQRAETVHAAALQALASGRYEDAWQGLRSLLELTRLRRTRYVIARRAEIREERARAERGREVAAFARLLPGARLLDRGEGRAELVVDFEHADAADAVTTRPGRHGVRARRLLVANLPAGDGDGPALRHDRFLAWEPWDGAPEHHPSRFPVDVGHPFDVGRPVVVEFEYRSDAPYFLLVAVDGMCAGVLSAPEDREGGRGVRVFAADSLERLDEHFGERFRSSYLRRHPELLRREGDTRYFRFEPGRTYRVRFVKDDRRARLVIGNRVVAEAEVRTRSTSGPLAGRVVLLSYTSGEVDDLRVAGTLDPAFTRNRR